LSTLIHSNFSIQETLAHVIGLEISWDEAYGVLISTALTPMEIRAGAGLKLILSDLSNSLVLQMLNLGYDTQEAVSIISTLKIDSFEVN
jgi:hypothetical protein